MAAVLVSLTEVTQLL